MAWLESHQTLARHPKTLRAAKLLGISVPTLIGHLHLLWWWCLDYAEDGDLSGLENEEIAQTALWTGDPQTFTDALLKAGQPSKAGFLERSSNGHLLVHDWDEYTGMLIARRKRNAQHKRDVRSLSAPRPQPVSTMSGATVPNQPYPTNTTVPQGSPPQRASASEKPTRVKDLRGDTEFLAALKAKFPDQDIDLALVACDDHWQDRVKAPKKALINWLQKAKQFATERGASDGKPGIIKGELSPWQHYGEDHGGESKKTG